MNLGQAPMNLDQALALMNLALAQCQEVWNLDQALVNLDQALDQPLDQALDQVLDQALDQCPKKLRLLKMFRRLCIT